MYSMEKKARKFTGLIRTRVVSKLKTIDSYT